MGDPAMTPLPAMDKIIDYAHLSQRSPRLDILLCAAAKCFIGCSSGLAFVAIAFGVPCSMVNMAPMSGHAITWQDLGIPKLHYSGLECRVLRFDEVFASPLAGFRFTHQYEESNVRVLENDSDDILELTREMLDRASGNCIYSDEDELLQQRYRDLFRPGHYGYQSSARVSRAFLKKYRALLEPNI